MEGNTCRTCMKSAEEGIWLFTPCPTCPEGALYSELLARAAGVKVYQKDGLPARVCVPCSQLLPQTWSFLSMCRASDSLLRAAQPDIKPLKDDIKLEIKQETGLERAELLLETVVEEKEDIEGEGEASHSPWEADLEVPQTKTKGRKRLKKRKAFVSKQWKCEECGEKVETECRLKKHYKREHPDIQYTYPCKDCGKVFKRKTDLHIHSRTHNGERPYKCDMCGAGFSQWGTLRQHKYSHTGERPYSCTFPKCKARFASTASLRRHGLTHGGDRRHVCEKCGCKFKCAPALRAHYGSHSTQRPHKCTQCGRMFKSRLSLRNHQLTHGDRTFVCEDCGKEFFIKGNLSRHRKKMHTEGAGTCPICHKATSDLKEHSSVHSEELNFKCEVCQKGFRHKGILNAHLVLHKNANKYKCPAEGCTKTFCRKNLLEFHHNKVHTSKASHQCPHCPQGFYRLSDTTRHINTFHPNQPPLQEVCGK